MRFGQKTITSLIAWSFSTNAWCRTVTWIEPGQVNLSSDEPVVLQFHIPGLQPGTNVRLKAAHGRIQTQPVREPGLLVAEYQPDPVTGTHKDSIDFRIRSLGLLETVPIQLSSMNIAPDAVEFEPAWIEARPNEEIRALVRIAKTQDHPPWLRTSSGKLSKPQSDGDDWVWTWTQVNAPESSAVVSFLLTDPTLPGNVQATGVLPLHIAQNMTLNGPPGFSCALAQGEERSDGVEVTPAGTLAMSVAIDPTKTTATIECINPLGQIRNYPIQLKLADVPLFVMGAIPSRLPVGVQPATHATFFGIHPDGSPNLSVAPNLEGTGIAVGSIEPGDLPGTWRASLRPESSGQLWTVAAEMQGHAHEQQGQTILSIPAMTVSANPPTLSPSQPTTTLQIELISDIETASYGLPALKISNGTALSRLKRNDLGAIMPVRIEKAKDGIWALSSPPPNETGLPVAKVLAWAPNSTLLADGRSLRPIAIVATDAMGHGASRVKVELSVDANSDAKLSSAIVQTGANGVAWAWLTAGTNPGPLVVHASISNDHTTASFLALPADGSTCNTNPTACESHSFVPDGGQTRRALETYWQKRVLLSWIPNQEEPLALSEPNQDPTSEGHQETINTPNLPTSQADSMQDDGSRITNRPFDERPAKSQTMPLPRARLSAGVASLSHVYQSESPVGAAAPSPVNHQKGNLLEGNPIGSIAGTGHIRVNLQQVSVDAGWLGSRMHLGQSEDLAPTQFHSGWIDVRRNHQIHPSWHVNYGVGAAYQGFHVLLYDTNQPGTLMVHHMPTPGARMVAGAQWIHNQTQVELEFSETFVPWPVRSTALLRAHREIQPNLYGTIGIHFHARSARFAAGTDEIVVTDQLHVLNFGITKALP